MKIVSFILLTLFLGKGCSDSVSKEMKNTRIEYSATSRGFYQNIIVQNSELFLQNDRNNPDKKVISISESDWKELVTDFQLIELEKLSSFKDPTQKRFSDGAAIANVKIVFKEKDYQSVEFDHGNPPVEIEKMIHKIVELANKK